MKKFITLALACMALACNQAQDVAPARSTAKNDDSCRKPTQFGIRNGTVIQDSEYPAVTKFEDQTGFCTGTFVSDSVYITAAHCTSDYGKNQNADVNLFSVNNVKPTKIFQHPTYFTFDGTDVFNHDLSVVIFPANTSGSYIELNDRAPQVGDGVVIVGYGSTTLNGSDPTVNKRKGDNTVAGFKSNNQIILKSPGALGGPGDSGGPLLIDGKLAGTTYYGNETEEWYVNLNDAANMSFIRQAVSESGKPICGLDGYECGAPNPPDDRTGSDIPPTNEPGSESSSEEEGSNCS